MVNILKPAGAGMDKSTMSFKTRLKPLAQIGRFKEKCKGCQRVVDYTDKMVLDNLIRCLAGEDIKKKALAKPEGNLTLDVLKSVQTEEIEKLSISNLNINVGHGTVYASIACYVGE